MASVETVIGFSDAGELLAKKWSHGLMPPIEGHRDAIVVFDVSAAWERDHTEQGGYQ